MQKVASSFSYHINFRQARSRETSKPLSQVPSIRVPNRKVDATDLSIYLSIYLSGQYNSAKHPFHSIRPPRFAHVSLSLCLSVSVSLSARPPEQMALLSPAPPFATPLVNTCDRDRDRRKRKSQKHVTKIERRGEEVDGRWRDLVTLLLLLLLTIVATYSPKSAAAGEIVLGRQYRRRRANSNGLTSLDFPGRYYLNQQADPSLLVNPIC